MSKLIVSPEVFLVGETQLLNDGVFDYLRASGNEAFIATINEARLYSNASDAQILCSMFAKLCYASLTLGKNDNLTRIRSIPDNFKSVLTTGHGSILEHIQFNFIVHNCSRVLTHELIRHRVGTAFSQTSGRYVRSDQISLVLDPILNPVVNEIEAVLEFIEAKYAQMVEKLAVDQQDFHIKKKMTSALRRIMPNGQANEMAVSLNLRTLRHTILMRTAAGAEWEIREVFGQIYRIMKGRYPELFQDACEREVDGALEVYGMKMQPYEMALDSYSEEELKSALALKTVQKSM